MNNAIRLSKTWLTFSAVAAGCAGIVLSAAAEPVDGTYYWTGNDGKTGTACYWRNTTIAADGGIATFSGDLSVDNNLSGWQLGGLNFEGNNNKQMTGNAITLVGDRPFLASNNAGGPQLSLTLQGTGDNVLSFVGARGMGQYGLIRLLLSASLTNFGEFRVESGKVGMLSTSTAAPVTSSVKRLVPAGGILDCSNQKNVAHDMSATTLVAGRGAGTYAVGAGLTATFKDVDVEAGGGLALQPKGGRAALGETILVKALTAPALLGCGIVDPRIVVRDEAASLAFSFLTYDATKGFVPFADTSLVDVSTATQDDVAKISPAEAGGAVSVSGGKTVGALLVDNRAQATLSGTLTVGDGKDAAGVVFRMSEATGSKPSLTGGTIDFGTSPGVLWAGTARAGSGTTEPSVTIGSTIAGSAGVTFAGQPTVAYDKPAWFLTSAAGWTGPTYVNGSTLSVKASDRLPSGGDVYVARTGMLFLDGTLALNQNLHLKGQGLVGCPSAAGADFVEPAAVMLSPAAGVKFAGTVELEDSTRFMGRCSNTAKMEFAGKVTGPGRLYFYAHKSAVFSNPDNDWTGGLFLQAFNDKSAPVTVAAGSSLGTGPIALGNGSLAVKDHAGLVLHDVTSSGSAGDHHANRGVGIEASKVTFAGTSKLAKLDVDTLTYSNGCSTVVVGDSLSVGNLSWFNGGGSGAFAAQKTGSTLRLGDETDSTVNAGLTDGAGKLTLVKQGAGTVTLVNSQNGQRNFTGGVRVEKGTLRVEGDVLHSPGSVSYWLDAADADSFECGSGNSVQKWKSKFGSAFFKTGEKALPTRVELEDGLAVVNFPADGVFHQLIGDGSYPHKTTFIVYKITTADLANMAPSSSGTAYVPMFYALGGRAAVRIPAIAQTTSATFENYMNNNYFLQMHAQLLVNGGSNMSVGVGDKFNVVTARRVMDGYDSHKPEISQSTFFQPVLGGNSGSNYFAGSIGEIIVFNRLLTANERMTVEDYLAKKWRGSALYASVGAQPSVLPANVDVDISPDAVLDVHGTDLVLGSLTGVGTITNSSSKAATVRVADGTFAGRVTGPVTLVTSGGAYGLSLEQDASLDLAGGTTRIAPYNYLPPTNHVAYWLDATVGAKVTRDASTKKVSSWASIVPSAASAMTQTTSSKQPVYTEKCFGDLPGVSFGPDATIAADRATVTRTMFFVFKADTANIGTYKTLWGSDGSRCLRTEGGISISAPGRLQYWMNGGCFRVNGVDNSTKSYTFVNNQPTLFTVRIDDTHPDDEKTYGGGVAYNKANYIGPGVAHCAAELIAYTNRLDDAQMAAVEKYLMDKWSIAGHQPPAVRTQVVNGTGSVSVSGEATLDGDFELNGPLVLKTVGAKGEATVNPFAVTGALTIGADATLTVDDFTWLNRKRSCDGRYCLVDAAGGVTGSFKSTNLDGNKKWELVKDVRGWVAVAIRGLMAIVR